MRPEPLRSETAASGKLETCPDDLALGFSVALNWQNVLWCLMGVVLGTLVGVLPGIGPVATIAMLLPVTFTLPPISALIMLAGIYYGAQYGGSTTAILVNLPGESSSVVTALDGYQMARQGRADPVVKRVTGREDADLATARRQHRLDGIGEGRRPGNLLAMDGRPGQVEAAAAIALAAAVPSGADATSHLLQPNSPARSDRA